MTAARLLVLAAGSIALGAMCVGRGLLLPELDGAHGLIDPNLAKTLARPLHLRLADVAVVASLTIGMAMRRLDLPRWATSLSLVAVGTALFQRFVLLPALYEAWAASDLVTGRPLERIDDARRLSTDDSAMTLALVLLFATLSVVTVWRSSLSGRVVPRPAPTPAQPEQPEQPERRATEPLAAA